MQVIGEVRTTAFWQAVCCLAGSWSKTFLSWSLRIKDSEKNEWVREGNIKSSRQNGIILLGVGGKRLYVFLSVLFSMPRQFGSHYNYHYHLPLKGLIFPSRLFSFSDTRILLWLYPQLTSRLPFNLPFIIYFLTQLLIFRRDMSSRGPRILSRLCFNLLSHSLGRHTFLPLPRMIPPTKQLFLLLLPLFQLPIPPQYGDQLQALVSNQALARLQSLPTHSICRPLT